MGRIAPLVLFAVVAAGITAGVQEFDRIRANARLSDFGLHTARQIAAQAEGLVLNAKVRAEKDPIHWAVKFLAQGVEPRTIQISKHRGQVGVPSESYVFLPDGWFDYTKVSQPENGAGIRVRLNLGYRGFLDSRTTFGNDISVAMFFGLLWFALQGIVGIVGFSRFSRSQEAAAVPVPTPSEPDWTARSESLVLQLATRFLDLLRVTTDFKKAALTPIGQRSDARREVHADLHRLRQARRAMKLSEKALLAAEEALAQPGGAEDPEKIRKWLSATRTLGGQVEASLREMEIGLEPRATDLDLAVQTDAEMTRMAEMVSTRVDAAKGALQEQARFLRDLRRDRVA